ncbi:MAG TPA: outer membrane beta-barrel protein [Novosphingobium sp.]|nr:outer membrane beta-barrel protein [Novosphingobium sp.]
MRLVLLSLAASLAVASPALANEGRIEARGGVVWDSGTTEDVYGIAAGYDFDLGSSAFAGVEVSGDKIASSGTKVAFGATGRLGAKVGGRTKVYVDGGYTSETCSGCEDAIHAGAGVELGFGQNLYGKLGYRHFFVNNGFSDFDAVVVGLGVQF